ncbi:hypothetical protein B0I35DRAFT_403912 [Stachybotrys elegans]|uniref:Uncharacterized protein n=1 Tax=Stachybotrys elegans TaxID=80388 RepID=A0A8K0T394_9HYPO|nr:hypothetical protein B0I35DRAFT_403912 [Stachybotrys elegans]
MAQDQDVYRKIGRGGAGNFFTPKQAEQKAEEAASRDLEAQKRDGTPISKAGAAPAVGMARAGRGGAGNFVDRGEAARREDQDLASAVMTAGLKSVPRVGRGGAGNWLGGSGEEADKRQAEEEEGLRRAELERLAAEEVDKGLRMPDKVHHGEEKRRE